MQSATNTVASTQLTAKLLEEKLKVGWAPADFAKRLSLTEEEFWEKLDQNFSGKALVAYKRRLVANCKKRQKSINRQKSNTAAKKRQQITEVIPIVTVISDETVSTETQNQKDTESSKIETLEAEVAEAKKMICELEANHVKLVSERKTIRDGLVYFRDELVKLQKLMEEKLEEVEKSSLRLDEIAKECESINSDIEDLKKLISDNEETISKLRITSIVISEEGIDVSPEYPIPEEWKSIREQWLDDSRFELLTGIELRFFAQVVAISKELAANGKRYEVIFASDKLQELFDEIMA